jgi:hypothetical protein
MAPAANGFPEVSDDRARSDRHADLAHPGGGHLPPLAVFGAPAQRIAFDIFLAGALKAV